MKIGIISDTHGFLDPKVFDYFKDCDAIWHGGDIGGGAIIEQLEALKSIKAVFGNIDDNKVRHTFPENNYFKVDNLNVLITHIAGSPPNYNARVKKFLKENKVDVLVCGHSHILKVMRDPVFNLLFINPGAAGIHGFHKMRTIITFEINNSKVEQMKVIELGLRGKIN